MKKKQPQVGIVTTFTCPACGGSAFDETDYRMNWVEFGGTLPDGRRYDAYEKRIVMCPCGQSGVRTAYRLGESNG